MIQLILFHFIILCANFLCSPVISLVLEIVVFCSVFVLLRPFLATGDNFNVATKLSPSETEHCRTRKMSPSPAEVYSLLFQIHPRLQTSYDKSLILFFIRLYKTCCRMMLYCRCRRRCCGSVNESLSTQ